MNEHVDSLLGPEATDEPVETQEAPEAPEAKAEEAEETEVKSEDKADDDKPEKTVPYGALHEERQLRKEAQAQANSLKAEMQQFAQLREELAAYRESQRQAREAAESDAKARQFEDDPIGSLKSQVVDINERIKREQEQNQLAAQYNQEMQQFQSAVTSQVQSFKSEHKDYDDAFNYVMSRRVSDLKAMGIEDPATIQQAINQEAMGFAFQAMQMNRNPAEVLYNLASSWGYKPSKGGSEEKITTIEKGQRAAKSLSGTSTSQELDLGDVEGMSDEDFDKLWASLEKAAR